MSTALELKCIKDITSTFGGSVGFALITVFGLIQNSIRSEFHIIDIKFSILIGIMLTILLSVLLSILIYKLTQKLSLKILNVVRIEEKTNLPTNI